ncbi:MAG: hypothetical protein ACYSW4_03855 [Planctomycetota bacterium]|jgi:phage FluMu protein Com
MEESKKKPVMIGVIIVCFAVAGAITYMTRSREPYENPEDLENIMMWVKCRNPQCEGEYEISMKEHADFWKQYKLDNPGIQRAPTMICKSCGEESVYRATKCAKCGLVFEIVRRRGDYADRCPKCKYSQTEVEREKTAEARRAVRTKGTAPE